MTDQPLPQSIRDEMHELVTASLRRDISVEQRARLDELVCLDIKACDLYLDLLFESSALIAWAKDNESEGNQLLASDQTGNGIHAYPHNDAQRESELSATPALFGNAIHNTAAYFSSGWPVAYLVATVILGIGFVIGGLVHVSTPIQVVHTSISSPSPLAPSPSSQPFVGRITGMVDCQWADPQTEAFNGASIPLGRKYALSSGLMEITYDTGAKVILQGPVTYEVESAASGYLSIGKLTAKLEKKSEETTSLPTTSGRGAGGDDSVSSIQHSSPGPQPLAPSPPSNPQSPNPNPLFCVRTPTATITDLGTEFGVEVTQEGTVETTVLSGKVTLAVSGKHAGREEPQTLVAGQLARVLVKDGVPSITLDAANGERFIRAIRVTHSETLLSPAVCNGSFEYPALGSAYFDADAGNLSVGVYAKIHDVVPPYWNPTSSLQSKGTFVRGVTGEQYVVLQSPSPVLSTQFDGAIGHPAARKYEPHSVYVLTADIGSNMAGVEAIVCFEDGEHTLRRSVPVFEANVMQSMPPMELNTDRNREFIGKSIAIKFAKRNEGDQLYIDNVTLKAVRQFANVSRPKATTKDEKEAAATQQPETNQP